MAKKQQRDRLWTHYDERGQNQDQEVSGRVGSGVRFNLLRMFRLHRQPTALDQGGTREEQQDHESMMNWFQSQFSIPEQRSQAYEIYRRMDHDMVGAMLDLYAEEATQPDTQTNRVVWVESENSKVKEEAHKALHNIMADDTAMPIARDLAKLGDHFRRTIYASGHGMLGWQYAPENEMERIEDKSGRLVGFTQSGKTFRGKQRKESWPWDYVHFRLLGRNSRSGYGTPLIEPIFRTWRQVKLAEDSILMYRLRRTPDRNLIMVDVGDMEEGEAEQYAHEYRKRLKKHQYVDPASNRYATEYNPFQPFDDVVIPMRGDEKTRLQKLSGGGQADRIYDLEYYMRKLFSLSRIPRSYMGYENESTNKNSLLQLDVRFARTIKRLRKALVYGYRQTLDIHFALLSPHDDPDKWWPYKSENEYTVEMAPISYLDEYERLELVRLRFELIQTLSRITRDLNLDPQTWATYILLTYAKLPEHVVTKLTAKADDQQGFESTDDPFANFEAFAEAQNLDESERQSWRNDPEAIKKVFSSVVSGSSAGYYSLNESEKQLVADAVASSAGLRQQIGRMAEDEVDQIDPSVLPPAASAEALKDVVGEDDAKKRLDEDLNEIENAGG